MLLCLRRLLGDLDVGGASCVAGHNLEDGKANGVDWVILVVREHCAIEIMINTRNALATTAWVAY